MTRSSAHAPLPARATSFAVAAALLLLAAGTTNPADAQPNRATTLQPTQGRSIVTPRPATRGTNTVRSTGSLRPSAAGNHRSARTYGEFDPQQLPTTTRILQSRAVQAAQAARFDRLADRFSSRATGRDSQRFTDEAFASRLNRARNTRLSTPLEQQWRNRRDPDNPRNRSGSGAITTPTYRSTVTAQRMTALGSRLRTQFREVPGTAASRNRQHRHTTQSTFHAGPRAAATQLRDRLRSRTATPRQLFDRGNDRRRR